MSKIRNSLGVIVLPTPTEKMSFQEYKDAFGIDLHSIFEIHEGQSFAIKPEVSKIFAIDFRGAKSVYGYYLIPNVAIVDNIMVSSTGEVGKYDEYHTEFPFMDLKLVIAHKVYADGETPDEYFVMSNEV